MNKTNLIRLAPSDVPVRVRQAVVRVAEAKTRGRPVDQVAERPKPGREPESLKNLL